MGCACVRNADMSVDIDVIKDADKTVDVDTNLDTIVDKTVDKTVDKGDNTQDDKIPNTNTIESSMIDDRIPSVVEDIVSTQSIHLDITNVDDNYVSSDNNRDEWCDV